MEGSVELGIGIVGREQGNLDKRLMAVDTEEGDRPRSR